MKIALENYDHFVASVERVKLELEDLDTKRFKVGGCIAKIPENPSRREEVILNNLERLTILEKELDYYQRNVDMVTNFIESLEDTSNDPIKNIVVDKYINKIGIYDLEIKYKVDRKTIWRRINESLKSSN
ncbi:hypothetical protein HGB07_09200 [Candidatus Roizmanbacteria bacterium]|nr:hypothetical protein [Candidatus Roizmanbacteria bacterium]